MKKPGLSQPAAAQRAGLHCARAGEQRCLQGDSNGWARRPSASTGTGLRSSRLRTRMRRGCGPTVRRSHGAVPDTVDGHCFEQSTDDSIVVHKYSTDHR
ncbi:hypothetical protein MRX96_021768 [Rhipicephalus microplus]